MRPSVVKVIALSMREPGYMAAMRPSAMDIGMAMIETTPARRRVLTSLGPIISEMGVPMVPAPEPAFDMPRSPVAMSPSQRK